MNDDDDDDDTLSRRRRRNAKMAAGAISIRIGDFINEEDALLSLAEKKVLEAAQETLREFGRRITSSE